MDQIEHRYVEINGLKLHVADTGSRSSPAVVFLYGFPEIWYSWRHQMVAISKVGFRALAPDYRGYGLSDQPPEPENASYADLVADLRALLDALSIKKAFLISKDMGTRVAHVFTVLYPEKVSGIVTLGIPPFPLIPFVPFELLPKGFYVTRWQEPRRAEADFSRLDATTAVRNVYILFSRSELPIAHENQEIMDMVDPSTPLPHWFTEEDLQVYGSLYEKSGFQTALKVPYRSINEKYNVPNDRINAPVLFIVGEKDIFIKFPGMEAYIRNEQAKTLATQLETVYIPEGCHFVQEQFPEQVNQLIIEFLKAHDSQMIKCGSRYSALDT